MSLITFLRWDAMNSLSYSKNLCQCLEFACLFENRCIHVKSTKASEHLFMMVGWFKLCEQKQVGNGGHLQLKMINTHAVLFNEVLISGAFHSHQITICHANFLVSVD